jgi:hypothetical protein
MIESRLTEWVRPFGVSEVQRHKRKTVASANRVGMALKAIGFSLDVDAIYEELLGEMVLSSASLAGPDRKDALRYARILKDREAYAVLTIIWKESAFVSDETLRAAGVARTFEDVELSAYRIAVSFADAPQHLAATNSRVRAICLAAEHFGLIERIAHAQTRVALRGTKLLHHFMLAISERIIDIISAWQTDLK